jgi:poly(3-hydroxybutyrate) depolymerase
MITNRKRLFVRAMFVVAPLSVGAVVSAAQKSGNRFFESFDRGQLHGIPFTGLCAARVFALEKMAVILALHGGGEYGSDGLKHTASSLANAIRRTPERFPAIVVFPQAQPDGTPGWQLEGGQAALQELDKTLKEFNGDANRIVLTGYSAGGNGTWSIASRYPERFAATGPICGFVAAARDAIALTLTTPSPSVDLMARHSHSGLQPGGVRTRAHQRELEPLKWRVPPLVVSAPAAGVTVRSWPWCWD